MKDCNNKKKVSNRIIEFSPLEDYLGKYIPYCNFRHHPGIVYNGAHKKCERVKCQHYEKYRPHEKKAPDIHIEYERNTENDYTI